MYPLLKNARWTWTVLACGLPSLWYWSEPIIRPPDLSLWIAHGVIFAVFTAALYLGYRLADRYPSSVIVALVALAFIATPINPNAVIFIIYAAGFVGAFRQVGISALVAVVLLMATAAQAWLLGAGTAYWTAMALFVVSVASYSIFSATHLRHDSVLRLKQEELERLAQLAERERIARDLHDSVGHSLSLIAVKLHLAEKLISDRPDDARSEIQQLREVVRSSLREVRDLVHDYSHQGFQNVIENGRLGLQAAGIEPDFDFEQVDLASETDQALGFVVREALTNVIRHSEATHCRLRLQRQAGRVVLRVEDDGVGELDRTGFGVRSIHERIAALGGQVEFTRGQGLKLKVSIPCAEPSAAETDLVPAIAQ